MNVLLIYSTDNIDPSGKFLNHPGRMFFGFSYISSVLKKNGFNVKLLVLSRILGKRNYSLINDCIGKFQPSLIAYTAVASEYPFITDIAKYITENFKNIFHVIGGVHASLNPEDAIYNSFDAVCIGEGEYPLLELASCLKDGKDYSSIQNFWFKNDGQLIKNPPRDFISDLDSLPFADRILWDEWIEDRPEAQYMILLGRGCPFQCTYCSNHALKKIANGKYVRFRSPDNIIAEISNILTSKPEKRKYFFEIDTILVDFKWISELCLKLEEFNNSLDSPISFGTNIRIFPNCDIKAVLDLLIRANCKYINIGLESGSERVRTEILKRKYSNELFIDTVNYAKSIGLEVFTYNMIGLPTETIAEYRETIQLNRLVQPSMTRTSIFFPYKGTVLYDYCIDNNLIDETKKNFIERTDTVLTMPQFSRKDILKGFTWFDFHVYKGIRPSSKFFIQAIIKNIIAKPYFIYINRIISSKGIRRILRRFLS
jgi:radical SAM superfamily enzyme YgiQ (UPF0313 family)